MPEGTDERGGGQMAGWRWVGAPRNLTRRCEIRILVPLPYEEDDHNGAAAGRKRQSAHPLVWCGAWSQCGMSLLAGEISKSRKVRSPTCAKKGR